MQFERPIPVMKKEASKGLNSPSTIYWKKSELIYYTEASRNMGAIRPKKVPFSGLFGLMCRRVYLP